MTLIEYKGFFTSFHINKTRRVCDSKRIFLLCLNYHPATEGPRQEGGEGLPGGEWEAPQGEKGNQKSLEEDRLRNAGRSMASS